MWRVEQRGGEGGERAASRESRRWREREMTRPPPTPPPAPRPPFAPTPFLCKCKYHPELPPSTVIRRSGTRAPRKKDPRLNTPSHGARSNSRGGRHGRRVPNRVGQGPGPPPGVDGAAVVELPQEPPQCAQAADGAAQAGEEAARASSRERPFWRRGGVVVGLVDVGLVVLVVLVAPRRSSRTSPRPQRGQLDGQAVVDARGPVGSSCVD